MFSLLRRGLPPVCNKAARAEGTRTALQAFEFLFQAQQRALRIRVGQLLAAHARIHICSPAHSASAPGLQHSPCSSALGQLSRKVQCEARPPASASVAALDLHLSRGHTAIPLAPTRAV